MDQGQLTINGVTPFDLRPKELAEFRNKQLGFIFQFHQCCPNLAL